MPTAEQTHPGAGVIAWRAFWRDFVDGFAYVRDPHGWWQRRRHAKQLKFQPRPAMFRSGDDFIVHPAVEARLRRELAPVDDRLSPFGLFAPRIYVSVHAVEAPPSSGWPDIAVPERPRLAP